MSKDVKVVEPVKEGKTRKSAVINLTVESLKLFPEAKVGILLAKRSQREVIGVSFKGDHYEIENSRLIEKGSLSAAEQEWFTVTIDELEAKLSELIGRKRILEVVLLLEEVSNEE